MINVYISVSIINNVNDILEKILNKINDSGLYDKCNKIILIINGDVNELEYKKRAKYEEYIVNTHINECEFPALFKIYNDCLNLDEEIKVLYLHTKGVTKPNIQSIIDWVDYMLYFNVDKYDECYKKIQQFDVIGVNFSGNQDDINEPPQTWGYGKAPLHFSGNFWWSKSTHINKLPNPYIWCPNNDYIKWRIMCEMWICSKNGLFLSMHNSNKNHYYELYPKELYV